MSRTTYNNITLYVTPQDDGSVLIELCDGEGGTVVDLNTTPDAADAIAERLTTAAAAARENGAG